MDGNTRFKSLILKKIKDKGYRSIRQFADLNKISRSPISKTISGATIPEKATVQRWCALLDCSAQERTEIFQAIYVPEEVEQVAA